MFYHLINSKQFNLDLTIVDVEELNHKVLNHELDISKVSIYTAMKVKNHYNLLDSGAALGENCGPLLVTKVKNVKKMKDAEIAIPGRNTTANLLFSLYAKNEGRKVFMPFSQIMPAVKEGGMIIIAAKCTEEIGSEEFVELLMNEDDLDKFMEKINNPEFFTIDQWELEELVKVRKKADIYLYSDCNSM